MMVGRPLSDLFNKERDIPLGSPRLNVHHLTDGKKVQPCSLQVRSGEIVGLAGLVATNTTISREGLKTDAEAAAAIGAGGLSGAPLRPRALEVLRLVRSAVPDSFCVIAAGGVETADDVRERLAAGADLVQGYTGFIYRGPLWARQINRGLARG